MRKNGFTLLELMLAITLFSVAAIIAVSALFGVIAFQRKSLALQRVQNNINFAVKAMTVDIAVGDLYHCATTVPSGPINDILPQSCWSGGGPLIVFRNVRDEKTVYRLDNGVIERCVDVSASGVCDTGSGPDYLQLTSSSVDIDNDCTGGPCSLFYVDGAEGTAAGDTKQPRTQVVISARAAVGRETEVINLQTTVSQFRPDF